jgi:division/cell wall cluster transcriptional repressor MraZ
MADGGIEQTIRYTDTFEHLVDAARRVQVPSEWRPKGTGTTTVFVKVWGDGQTPKHLRVMSAREFDRMEADFDAMAEQDPAMNVFRRGLYANMQSVELDSAGRICLKKDTAEAAGIKPKEVVQMVGGGKFFEIWNAAALKATTAMVAEHKSAKLLVSPDKLAKFGMAQ